MADDPDPPDDDTPHPAPAPRRHTGSLDPAIYMVEEPSPGEQRLLDAWDRAAGDPAPAHMVAKLARRGYRRDVWQGKLDGYFRRARRWAIAGVVALATNLTAIGGYLLHRAAEAGAAEERATQQDRSQAEYRRDVRRELDLLRGDVAELRALLFKLTGATTPSTNGTAIVLAAPCQGPLPCPATAP